MLYISEAYDVAVFCCFLVLNVVLVFTWRSFSKLEAIFRSIESLIDFKPNIPRF